MFLKLNYYLNSKYKGINLLTHQSEKLTDKVE
jgi:hypothetical protein